MNCLLRCARQSFWQHEIGLVKEASGLALRIGSAWARAMEARWKGDAYEGALAAAIPEGLDLDDYSCATVAALLAGYYDYYGPIETMGKIFPEVQFQSQIEGTDFTAEGKMDGLGSMLDGRSVIVEAKTTGTSIDPDSDYWLRLRFNIQVLQYVTEARKLGWDIAAMFYDVTRKPQIKPKQVFSLDSQGRKIVVDRNGKRVYSKKKIGKGDSKKEVDNLDKPRQSGDDEKGWTVKSHCETPDEYCDRLWKDTIARPAFYFVRREIPVIDDEIVDFERERQGLAGLIEHYRSQEIAGQGEPGETAPRDPSAWPRAVSQDNCKFCSYASFCLQNISVDLNNPPDGFTINTFNPELDKYDYEASSEEVNATPTT